MENIIKLNLRQLANILIVLTSLVDFNTNAGDSFCCRYWMEQRPDINLRKAITYYFTLEGYSAAPKVQPKLVNETLASNRWENLSSAT